MGLARETVICHLRGDKPSVYDDMSSHLVFPCYIDVIEFDMGLKHIDLDIHHSGRVRVVYASSVNRAEEYVADRDDEDSFRTFAIQAGV